MTDLERAKFLAYKQIRERWTMDLNPDEEDELYRYLISKLRELVKGERDEQLNQGRN